MKKLTFVMAIIIFLSGCGEKQEQKRNAQPKEQPQPQQEESVPQEILLSSFKTTVHDNAEGRIHNINLCIKAINGKTLASGEVFSFNETVGERTAQRGYQKAKVLIEGEYVEDYGGGVCQVSTTIFNAAEIAGLEILERHTHDKPVNYVSEGRDAAVNYGSLDLKIKNNTDSNIRIDISKGESDIYANIVKIK